MSRPAQSLRLKARRSIKPPTAVAPRTITAISVKQPYANLIASGQKTIETRSWPTDHRGDLLIVSSRNPAIAPAGCAVAIVRVVDCRPMTKHDEAAACCRLYAGAWAWILSDIRRVRPWPVRGQLRLFTAALRIRRAWSLK
jgi:hypothetical protein